ncbi:MAG TPA: hypothetical protein VGS20_09435 [Candidatus Acidoferrales bacterium]|nr:hypothetical protein [Candidatus Acidoferrales bacterium]
MKLGAKPAPVVGPQAIALPELGTYAQKFQNLPYSSPSASGMPGMDRLVKINHLKEKRLDEILLGGWIDLFTL